MTEQRLNFYVLSCHFYFCPLIFKFLYCFGFDAWDLGFLILPFDFPPRVLQNGMR